MAMNPEWKKKWLKALRSGRYKQTEGYLQLNGANCCLGVLCRTLRAPKHDPGGGSYVTFKWGEVRDGVDLPEPLRKEAGITKKEHATLVNMNDHKGYDFNRIADWVEKHL